MLTRAPKGTYDIVGDKLNDWRYLEDKLRNLCDDFGFNEIRTPMFEHTELFQRGVGETTDIVQKEMYDFEDKAGRSICLKPEGTAGVVRAYLENKIYADTQPTKLFYITPAFRYEKPQKGRFRQFHQFGVELFGSDSPVADAEVISIAAAMLDRLGIKNVVLNLNSLGGPECRKNYNAKLKGFLKENLNQLCPTCQERYEKNPLRVLDCKNESCQTVIKDAPLMIDNLGTECKAHFDELQSLLTAMNIDYVVNPWIVRGLDYYTKTVFEFISDEIGAQGTVCGGGRYNGLIEECGGQATPAVGFGTGIERLLLTIEASGGKREYKPTCDIYLGALGKEAKEVVVPLIMTLRNQGIHAEMDLMDRSAKAQMKYANKIGAKFAAIVGDNEIQRKQVTLKNMNEHEQNEMAFDEIAAFMLKTKLED